jgi:type IV secretory pathway VirB4 component
MATHPAKLLDLWDVVDDTVVTTGGCYVRGFKLKGLDSEHLCGAELLAAAAQLYDRFKRDLPEHLHVQFVLHSHQDNTEILNAYAASEPQSPLLKRQHNRRVRFVERSGSRRQDCYVFVSSVRSISARQFVQISEQIHIQRVAAAKELADAVRSALESAGIGSEPLSTAQLWGLLARGINPSRQAVPLPPSGSAAEEPVNPVHIDPLSPRDRLLQSEIRWEDGHVQVGNRFYKVLTLKAVPEHTRFTMMEIFGKLGMDFRLSVSVRIPEQRGIGRRLQLLRRWKNATAHNRHVSDDQAQHELGSANNLSALLAESAQKLVLVGMQLVLWAPSRAELDQRVGAITDKLLGAGLGWFEETRAHDRELFKSLPGLALRFERYLVMTSNNAVDLLPLFGPEQGDRNPALLMHTASGHHLFGFNPYERNRDNWNGCVFGAAGSGKSVIMNMLMVSAMLGQNHGCGRVLVVDFAGPKKSSYKMLSDLFDGCFQNVIAQQSSGLSPFPTASVARGEDGTVRGEVLARLVVLTDLLLENTAGGQESARNRIIIQRAMS